MDKSSRLKVALQKSGRLTDNSLDLLVRCGLKYSRGKDQLMCYGENMPLVVLDFGKCWLSIAVPDGVDYNGILSLHGKRIATTYPNILARYLRQNDVQ